MTAAADASFGAPGIAGSSKSPIRNSVVGQSLEVDVGSALCGMQEIGFSAFAIGRSEAIDGPGLSPGPHGGIGVTLMGDLPDGFAADGVVDHDMVGAEIVPELVGERRAGVFAGDVVETPVSAVAGGPEEQLDVDHVVRGSCCEAIPCF